jgi:hypothetical protein
LPSARDQRSFDREKREGDGTATSFVARIVWDDPLLGSGNARVEQVDATPILPAACLCAAVVLSVVLSVLPFTPAVLPSALSVTSPIVAVHSSGVAVTFDSVAATFGTVAVSPLRPDVWFAVLAVTLRGVAADFGDASADLRTLSADFGVLVNCPSDAGNRSVAADN